VIAVSPDPNGTYPPGTEFTLTVSSGVVNVDVPNVVTQIADDATKTLKDLGFRVGYATVDDPNAPDGTVVQQSVKAGTKAPKGTLITLTVNNHENQPSTPPTTPSETPPPSLPTSPGITIGG
jgi:serine/threonine-protein kinase